MKALTSLLLPLLALTAASCSPSLREHTAWIDAKPSITRTESGDTHLKASQGKTEVSAYLATGGRRPPVKLDPHKSYRFEFLQKDASEESWDTELVRIFDGDRLIHDLSVCPVHHIPMQRRTVPIGYGLFRYSKEEVKARDRLFPEANSWVQGGCVVMDETKERVFQCEACLAAERKWLAAHPDP